MFGFNHSNSVVKTEFVLKGQWYVDISYLLKQHAKLLPNRSCFCCAIQRLISISKLVKLMVH